MTRKMGTEAFSNDNATWTTDTLLETECVGNATTVEVAKAAEESNGYHVSLPLPVSNSQDYHPPLTTVFGENVN